MKDNQTDRPDRVLIGILGLSVLLRVVSAIVLGDTVYDLPGTADQLSYHTLAIRLIDGHAFSFAEAWWPATQANAPTAHWSYLYTFYLGAIYALGGGHPMIARVIQAILVGILHPYLVYLIGKIVWNRVVGLIGAALTAIYAYFIYYGAVLMTEPFYITAVLGSLYFTILMGDRLSNAPENAPSGNNLPIVLGLGFSIGAAILLRQLFLLIAPLLLLWILWRGKIKAILPLILAGIVILGHILPFTLYNYARFNRFVLLNTNAGFALYWGNHPIYGTRFTPILPAETYIKLIPAELMNLDEAALDQTLLKRGVQFIFDNPQRYVLLSISRIPAYFMFWPSQESGTISNIARVASFGILWPFMLAGLVLAFRPGYKRSVIKLDSPLLLLIIFVTIYTLIHLLTWALIRYRLPVDAVMILFAGTGFLALLQSLGRTVQKWRS